MGFNYTKQQEDAIQTIDTDLQIIACAGSGKTEVISRRIVNILKSKKAEPSNIVAFTYTEKAAGELKNRINEIVQEELPGLTGMAEMYIGTIHGWCLKILQEHKFEFQKFDVLDEIRLKLFVDKHYKNIGMKEINQIDKPDAFMKMFVDTDKFIQIMGIVSEAKLTDTSTNLPPNISNARAKYENILKENGFLDFSMIMSEAKKYLSEDDQFYKQVCNKIKYLTIDEYQDVNSIQEDIIKLIYESNVNICVVGDDDQNIYQWRGSDINYILEFQNRYKSNVKQVKLIQNFRSSEGITNLAQTLINNNTKRLEKKMISKSHQNYERHDITWNEFELEEEENSFITKSIEKLRGKSFKDSNSSESRGLDYSDFAILIRKWSKAELITNALDKLNIPYVTGGVNKLFDTKEIKASLGIFQYLNKQINDSELKSLWASIDKISIDKAKFNYAVEELSSKFPIENETMFWDFCLQDIFWKFLDDAEIREESFKSSLTKHDNSFGEIVMFNLGKFSQVINDFETINYKTGSSPFYLFSFLNFIKHAAIEYYPEGWINSTYKTPNAVQIITIHQSKGLEFPVVFIPGMNRNYFPSKRKGGISIWKFLDSELIQNSDNYRGIEENFESERRLFYVAITRAKKYLFITRAPVLSNRLYQKPSSFISEISNSDFIISSKKEKYSSIPNLKPESKSSTNNITLSFSVLKDFFDCSYKFKLISIYGFAPSLSPRMGFGKTIHDSLSEIHKRAFIGDTINEKDSKEIISNHENFPYAPPKLKKEMRTSVNEIVENYIEQNKSSFPEIEFVEKDIQLNLGDGILISGRIDLIKRKDFQGNFETTIIEFKSNNKAQNKIITEEQLHLYALGHKELTGQKADYIKIYILQDKENLNKSNVGIKQKLEENHLLAIETKIRSIVKDIRKKNHSKCEQLSVCKNCELKRLCSGYKTSKLDNQ